MQFICDFTIYIIYRGWLHLAPTSFVVFMFYVNKNDG